jgi:phosphate/sulfate permease
MIPYADYLATVTGSSRAEYMQQLQATWLSAFCAFTGLVMHPARVVSAILGTTPQKYQQKSIIGPLASI